MQSSPGIREGFVRIEGRAKGSLFVAGMNVLGWVDGRPRNRVVYINPKAPEWFWQYCRSIKNTNTQVKVRVTKVVGGMTAFVGPLVDSHEEFEANKDLYLRAEKGEAFTEQQHLKAFEFHAEVAALKGLELVEHFRQGISSFTVARDPRSKAEFKIVGGMIVVKALPTYDGDKHKIETGRDFLIRVKSYDAMAPQD